MPDREKVIKGLEICYSPPSKCEDCPYHDLPDEQSCNDMLCLDALAVLKEQPQIVLCKDCVHRGQAEKCVLAAIAAEKDYPLFMLDNHGEWFCADGSYA